MKIIGIEDFKKLVMERIANRRDYTGRSLVLWNADYNNYGIAYQVIKQCCIEYDKENPNLQLWFRKSDIMFKDENYTESTVMSKPYEEYEFGCKYKRMGILLNTGCYLPKDQGDWFKFVNTHTNKYGHIFKDCVVIVCAQADQLTYFSSLKDPKMVLKEEQFGNNCDIYSIQPTLDEWVTWVTPYCHPEILKVVRAYLEKNGIANEPYGFEYWQRVMNSLNDLVKESDCPINQIPKEDIEMKIMGAVSTESPAPEFCNFIYEQDTEEGGYFFRQYPLVNDGQLIDN